jgi:hypothetical protein
MSLELSSWVNPETMRVWYSMRWVGTRSPGWSAAYAAKSATGAGRMARDTTLGENTVCKGSLGVNLERDHSLTKSVNRSALMTQCSRGSRKGEQVVWEEIAADRLKGTACCK